MKMSEMVERVESTAHKHTHTHRATTLASHATRR